MGEYVGIKGRKIKSLASDPTVVVGDIWYNTAGYKLKYGGESGTWSTAPTMQQGRSNLIGSPQGTTTAMLVYGGPGPLNYQYTRYTEQFNGTAWTQDNLLNVGRSSMGACGTTGAAVANSGHNLTPGSGLKITELWNGTAWTTGNDSNDVHKNCGGGGTQTAGIVAGGPGATNEFFNGTTWSAENDVVTPVSAAMMNGSQAEAYIAGGDPYSTATQAFDGTSWAASTSMSTGRNTMFNLGGDPNSSVVIAGGMDAPGSVTNATEMWNGTSWSTQGNLSLGRYDGGYGGTGTSGIIAGGSSTGPGYEAETETWAMGAAVKTVTTS